MSDTEGFNEKTEKREGLGDVIEYNDNSDNEEINEEVAKSMERLAKEQTEVAKASMGFDLNVEREKQPEKVSSDTKELMKTKEIPGDVLIDKTIDLGRDKDTIKDTVKKTSINEKKPATSKRKKKKKLNKKQKIAIIVTGSILIIAIIVVAIIMNVKSNEQNSYSYIYKKGSELYQASNYSEAESYLEKALQMDEGKSNTDAMMMLYDCYYKINNNKDTKIESLLKNVISIDRTNEKAVKALALYYKDNKDGAGINVLIKDYKNTGEANYLADYIVKKPTSSNESGKYDDSLAITLTSENNNLIYYTVDGSDPDNNSTKYEDIINLSKGTTIMKVIACDSIGVYSDIVTFTYNIDYKKPDAPEISPASGTYVAGSMISINNIGEGETAYYTIDGSTPTENSTKYTDSFEMPEGNNIISAIIIGNHDLQSAVTKRNYLVNKVTEYTYEECLGMLKYKMIQRGDMNSDDKNKDGKVINFVYENKITVNNVNMYLVRCDVTGVSAAYYGIEISTGKCYSIKKNNNEYSATDY